MPLTQHYVIYHFAQTRQSTLWGWSLMNVCVTWIQIRMVTLQQWLLTGCWSHHSSSSLHTVQEHQTLDFYLTFWQFMVCHSKRGFTCRTVPFNFSVTRLLVLWGTSWQNMVYLITMLVPRTMWWCCQDHWWIMNQEGSGRSSWGLMNVLKQ